ncbi:MAG TPA: GNAT family N-acetyltransferase [Bacteroidia bacterium]|jgi:diamine N-acetyltransferase|nr:GNAT family N-acetyltransferase [Bacteroidia bacterium]
MNLKGEHISLRALEPADLEILYKWENNPVIWKVSNTLAPFSKFVLEQYLVNAHEDIFTAKQIRLMISDKETKSVGTIELFDFDALNSRVGIGIMVENDSQNKGYAQDALQILMNYCFETLILKQIYCNISASNDKSIRLFKKLGFTEAGLKKNWNKISQNVFEDEYILQLVR